MKLIIVAIAALSLSACASAQTLSPDQPVGISKFTHDDLQSAAAYADGNGYPARAAVYRAIDTQLTACEAAIRAAAPKTQATGRGLFTAYEVAAEAVGQGIPAAVRINCGAIVLP